MRLLTVEQQRPGSRIAPRRHATLRRSGMDTASASSLLQALSGLQLGASDAATGNRVTVEGLAWGVDASGALELGLRELQAASLRLAADALPARRGGAPTPAWTLAPLAGAEGVLRAQITDAHLMFDADVTVPIGQGQVDFDKAAVEHVGPDSRMGVSPLGVYVDAPNGRSYLYQFPETPVAGVEFEKRGALLGPWVTGRGRLQLQPFAEGFVPQGVGAAAQGVTAPSRVLLERTALSGHVQLGDGRVAAGSFEAELAGRAERHNLLRVHSPALGQGVRIEVPSLSMRNAAWSAPGLQLRIDEIAGAFTLQLARQGAQLGFELDCAQLRIKGLRLTRAKS
jgi:hypothetical protein